MSVDRSARTRRYAPLTGSVVALVIVLFVLPSALNVPLSSPSQTLEFAPIPPSDEDPPPPETANLESLGLGSSSTTRGDGVGGTGPGPATPPATPPAAPPIPDGTGERPVTKRCVGDPPRQTEDPLSPPCVAHFDGDNFGATSHGVTGEEITILFYVDSSIADSVTSRGAEERPKNTYVDLVRDPPRDDDHIVVRGLRGLQNHFNDRFQTYERRVRIVVYFDPEGVSAESRGADATRNLEDVDPFAVIADTRDGYQNEYLSAMARAGRLNFGSFQSRPAAFYRQFPGLIWSVRPSIEEQAAVFVDYVCRKVVPHPTSFSGNDGENGQPRVLGLLRADDPRVPEITEFAAVVRQGIEACGGTFAHEGTYPVTNTSSGFRQSDGANNETSAQANMATFQANGVTTVIWAQGYEVTHTKAGARANYRPEWVIAGDRQIEGYQTGAFQDQSAFDEHAWVVTSNALAPDVEESFCFRAYLEGNPSLAPQDAKFLCQVRSYYDDLRLLFTGIQVAGPRLTVDRLDQGLHAIPPVPSTDPSIPTCFFNPDDFTCIKDAAAAWWDGDATNPYATAPGCWRFAEGGRRHFAGNWPDGDVLEQQSPDDPCSGFQGAAGNFA